MKTRNDILTDIYTIIKASPIDALNGGVYKVIRPTGSVLEDTVISIIPGTVSKFIQDGMLFVKIFFLDILQNGTYYEDTINSSAKETLLFNLSKTLLKSNAYSFDITTREVYVEPVDDNTIHQRYAILKIKFQIV